MTRTIRELDLADKVHFHGWINYEDIFSFLMTCDIGIATLHPYPNYLESMPTKMFEYMAAGLPVLMSNFPLWERVVKESECGVVADPLNPEEIAVKIDELLNHPDVIIQMGENGLKAVQKKYNWDFEEKTLFDVYNKLIPSK